MLQGFPGGSMVKNLHEMQETHETWVWSLGGEDPLEEEMASHSCILAWRFSTDRGAWQLWLMRSPSQTHWSDLTRAYLFQTLSFSSFYFFIHGLFFFFNSSTFTLFPEIHFQSYYIPRLFQLTTFSLLSSILCFGLLPIASVLTFLLNHVESSLREGIILPQTFNSLLPIPTFFKLKFLLSNKNEWILTSASR